MKKENYNILIDKSKNYIYGKINKELKNNSSPSVALISLYDNHAFGLRNIHGLLRKMVSNPT